MNRRLLLSAAVAVAATVAGGLTLLGRKDKSPAAGADAGDPVAALMQMQLPDLDGASHSLAGWKGQPMVVNFWATWCAPCVKEMPTLDALAVSLGDSVTVLVLSQDIEDGVAKVDAFFQKASFKKLQPYLDDKAEFSGSMGENLPVTILYDSTGKEVWRMRGSMDWTGQTARELIAEAK